MGMSTLLLGSAALCLGFIALVQCVPVEYVYTGDGCECPTSLGYRINVPKVPKTKKCAPSEYGYRLDVPVEAKGKVSYSFDFRVEEPRTPKPAKTSKLNLYAKVDRIAVNKGDCLDDYRSPHAPPCSCQRCGASKPVYRYVYKRLTPCRCQRPQCKCNGGRSLSPNSLQYASAASAMVPSTKMRSKRDLPRAFFLPRKITNEERQPRYVKLYHKSIPVEEERKPPGFRAFFGPFKQLGKRKTKRLIKRDIKGEYDMVEKERDQADLTLPEIIQYMPETLHPNFKRGQCQFGCSLRRQNKVSTPELTESKETTDASEEDSQRLRDGDDSVDKDQQSVQQNQSPSRNFIAVTQYTKRNAANYNQEALTTPAASERTIYATQQRLPTYAQTAYAADAVSPIPNNPLLGSAAAPQSAYSAHELTRVQLPQYLFDRLGQQFFTSALDSASIPLQYAGDLENPYTDDDSVLGSRQYPVQHISNAQLDRIISDIIYQHPDFIDASSHYGGALVDPEPIQAEQTKDFLKKLIEGRLRLSFKDDSDFDPFYVRNYQSYNPLTY